MGTFLKIYYWYRSMEFCLFWLVICLKISMLAICNFFLSQNHFRLFRQKKDKIKLSPIWNNPPNLRMGFRSGKKYLGFERKKLQYILKMPFLNAFQYSKAMMSNVYPNFHQSNKMGMITQFFKEKDIWISQLSYLFGFSALRSFWKL